MAIGIGRGGEMYLVLFVPVNFTFGEDEYTPRLQALDEFSYCPRIVYYLKGTCVSGQRGCDK